MKASDVAMDLIEEIWGFAQEKSNKDYWRRVSAEAAGMAAMARAFGDYELSEDMRDLSRLAEFYAFEMCAA